MTNPKKRQGDLKPGISCIPPSALIEEGLVMAGGAERYGPFNWNVNPVDCTTYYNAIWRHLASWYTRQDRDKKSGLLHLAHIRASCGILIDAAAKGTLIDDRPNTTDAAALIEAYTEGIIDPGIDPRCDPNVIPWPETH